MPNVSVDKRTFAILEKLAKEAPARGTTPGDIVKDMVRLFSKEIPKAARKRLGSRPKNVSEAILGFCYMRMDLARRGDEDKLTFTLVDLADYVEGFFAPGSDLGRLLRMARQDRWVDYQLVSRHRGEYRLVP